VAVLAASDADLVQFLIVALLVAGSAIVNWVRSSAQAQRRAVENATKRRAAPPPAPPALPAPPPTAPPRAPQGEFEDEMRRALVLEDARRRETEALGGSPFRREVPKVAAMAPPPPPPPAKKKKEPRRRAAEPMAEPSRTATEAGRAAGELPPLLPPAVAGRLNEAQRAILLAEVLRRPRALAAAGRKRTPPARPAG
jgi:hypothetical protein